MRRSPSIALLVLCLGCLGTPVLAKNNNRFRVDVLLRFEQEPDGFFIGQLRRQVERIFQPTQIDLWLRKFTPGMSTDARRRTVFFDVKGRCSNTRSQQLSTELVGMASLGWTFMQSEEAPSYAVIDCDQISRMVRSVRQQFPANHIHFIFERLSGRVLAHELMHILLGTKIHSERGVTQSPLKSHDIGLAPALSRAEIAALAELGSNSSDGPILSWWP